MSPIAGLAIFIMVVVAPHLPIKDAAWIGGVFSVVLIVSVVAEFIAALQ